MLRYRITCSSGASTILQAHFPAWMLMICILVIDWTYSVLHELLWVFTPFELHAYNYRSEQSRAAVKNLLSCYINNIVYGRYSIRTDLTIAASTILRLILGASIDIAYLWSIRKDPWLKQLILLRFFVSFSSWCTTVCKCDPAVDFFPIKSGWMYSDSSSLNFHLDERHAVYKRNIRFKVAAVSFSI